MGSASTRVKDIGPQPQSFDIEHATKENSNYRSVAWSGRSLQVTLMSTPGAAKYKLTFEKDGSNGWCVLVPAGTWHNITNTGTTPMEVYPVYAPAHHAPDNVQATAATAEADDHYEPAAWSEQPKHVPDKHGWADRPTAPFAARSFSNSLCMSRVGPNPGLRCVGMSGAGH